MVNKSKKRELLDSLRRSPDNQFFMNLKELLETINYEILRLLVKTTDKDEILRLQGKALLLEELVTDLTRKQPVNKQKTGAFN